MSRNLIQYRKGKKLSVGYISRNMISVMIVCLFFMLSCDQVTHPSTSTDESDNIPPVVQVERYSLLNGAESKYAVIYPKESQTHMKAMAKKISDKIESVISVKPGIFYDTRTQTKSEYEILIDVTNRPETNQYYNYLSPGQYLLTLTEDEQIVIMGDTVITTQKAVETFIKQILDTATTDGIIMKPGEIVIFDQTGNVVQRLEFEKNKPLDDKTRRLKMLENLIACCKSEGLCVSYEEVNYAVYKRFQDTVPSSDIRKYYQSAMDQIYSQAKNNLEAYLLGEKDPKTATLPNMDTVSVDGTLLMNGDTPVYSLGYGHFDQARKDIPNFNNMGITNIQTELGPNSILGMENGWGVEKNGAMDVDVSINHDPEYVMQGEYSLKITSRTPITPNVFCRLAQNVTCKPNTKYEIGVSVRGTADSFDMTGNGWAGERHWFYAQKNRWITHKFLHTTNNQTTTTIQLVIDGKCELYVDEFYMYEINSAGKRVGENLLKGSFEVDYDNNMASILSCLDTAQEYNIGISLLLSPHYVSIDKLDLPASVMVPAGGSSNIPYNIDAPETRALIEKYIRVVCGKIKEHGYTALQNIVLSNEPHYDTRDFSDFYTPLFREYLKEIHGSLERINDIYGTSYQSYNDIVMPKKFNAAQAGLYYDFVQFNDKVFADWHHWMADLVKEYLPDIPVNVKVACLNFMVDQTEAGTPGIMAEWDYLELFDRFSDYAGVDTVTYIHTPNTYYRTNMIYDFLHSVTGKPIYDSELHMMGDQDVNHNMQIAPYIGNQMFMGTVHGRNMASLWVWGLDGCSSDYLTRPDSVVEIGHTALDISRLSDKIAKFNLDTPKVAIFYSRETRLHDQQYFSGQFNTYKALSTAGYNIGYVTEQHLEHLSQYDTLIIPDVRYCSEDAYQAIEAYIKNGGNVICWTKSSKQGELLSMNVYGQVRDNSYILSHSSIYTSVSGYPSIRKVIEKMNAPITVETESDTIEQLVNFRYVVDGDKLLVAITYLNDSSNTTDISIKWNGEKLGEATDLISGDKTKDTVTLRGYTPMLLEFELP